MLLLMLMDFEIPSYRPPKEIPTIFEIQLIISKSPDFDSRIVLKNIGTESYENDLLSCNIYVNDKVLSNCVIETMKGHDFISTHHYGVQTISSMGCKGNFWNPREKLTLDLKDSTIKNGDNVKVEIIWKPTGSIISSDEYLND